MSFCISAMQKYSLTISGLFFFLLFGPGILLLFFFFFFDGKSKNRRPWFLRGFDGRHGLLLRFFLRLFDLFMLEARATVTMARRVPTCVFDLRLALLLFLLCSHRIVSTVGMISWSGCFGRAKSVRAVVALSFCDKRKMNV
jgi:hypothetical protein